MKLGEVPEWSKGADCKSVGYAFEGSNPSLPSGSDPCPQTVTAGGDCFLYGKRFDPPVQQFGRRGAPGMNRGMDRPAASKKILAAAINERYY